jgi:hypothetical protein
MVLVLEQGLSCRQLSLQLQLSLGPHLKCGSKHIVYYKLILYSGDRIQNKRGENFSFEEFIN